MKIRFPYKFIPDRQWLSNLNVSDILSQTTRYRTGAVLMVIAILMYQLVGIFYQAVSLKMIGRKLEPRTVQKPVAAPAAVAEPIDVYKVIPERNLFGSTDKTLAEKLAAANKGGAAAPTDITSTLEVRGTVAGDARYAFAVIEDKTQKKQKLYKVGDMIAGAKVLRIMRNSVAFKVDNQEKILKIPETSEKPILPGGAPGRPGLPAGAAAGGGGTITLNRSEIAGNLKDMGTMLSQAQIRPYFAAGVPDGFMVSNIKGGSIYQKIGLAEGDIIQGVNNRKMTSGDDMVELYNNLRSGSGMSMKIKRHGREENFNYIFR